jgi:hypothetical protein
MLSRYTPEETREVRAILNRLDLDRQRHAAVLGGYRS